MSPLRWFTSTPFTATAATRDKLLELGALVAEALAGAARTTSATVRAPIHLEARRAQALAHLIGEFDGHDHDMHGS